MRTPPLLSCLLALACPGTLFAQNLLIHYEFDQSGSSTATDSSGHGRHGAVTAWNGSAQVPAVLQTAAGVSGRPGDHAFDNTGASGMGGFGNRGGAVRWVGNGSAQTLGDLPSLTVSYWFKTPPSVVAGGTCRAVTLHNFAGDGTNFFENRFSDGGVGRTVVTGGSQRDTPSGTYGLADTWTFVAITLDGAAPEAERIKFYVGGLNSPATLAGAYSCPHAAIPLGDAVNALTLGGYHTGSGQTPFRALIDDFRLYGPAPGASGALTLEQLRTMQRAAYSSNHDDYPRDPLLRGGDIPVAKVWSGHRAGFDLLTAGRVQVVAYYDTARRIAVAARNLDSTLWHTQTLASTVGWDSHNYLRLGLDPLGHLHLSGNLHRDPMNYYRSSQPLSDASQVAAGFLQKIPVLVNAANELQSTYPSFLTGPKEEFIFSYRNQTSTTAGAWHLLKYDTGTQSYSPATPQPLFAINGLYSVYPVFTLHGGYLHCLYMWRGTTDAATNYNLSYIRTADLVNWQDAFGAPVSLPVTPAASSTLIDPVPQQGGLLNGQPRLGFDRNGAPLVAYHKYDASGKSQAYVARPGSASWLITQLTAQTSWRWHFSGGGTLPPGGSVHVGFVADDPIDGVASVEVSMRREDGTSVPGSGYHLLDETTLTTLSSSENLLYYSPGGPVSDSAFVDPDALENTFTHDGQSMQIRRQRSDGLAHAGEHYYLRWETLPSNRDQPRLDGSGHEISPPSSQLRLYRTQAEYGVPRRDAGGLVTGIMLKPAQAALAGGMTLVPDARRPFSAHLSSPGTGHAEWTFTLDHTADYALGGVTYSLTGTDDSFYVQFGTDPLIDWHLRGRWAYQPVTLGPDRGLQRFALIPGTHTLRVYAREAGARLESLWLHRPNVRKAISLGPISHSGFTITPDNRAVSGQSLGSPAGGNPAGFAARYEILVASPGNYLLLGRTRAQTPASDSFYLSVNGGSTETWHLPLSGSGWTWRAVGGSRSLPAGLLQLDVGGREGGAELDSFLLLRL